MANFTDQFTYRTGAATVPGYIHVRDDYYSVYCTVELGRSGTWEGKGICDISLRRYEGGKWTIVEMKGKGNVATGQNRNVTFSNIAKKNLAMDIRVRFYNPNNPSQLEYTVITRSWTR